MDIPAASLIAVGTVAIVGTLALQDRVPSSLRDAIVAIAGASLALGGLLLLEDPSVASWLLTPVVVAVLAVTHVRLLFAGEGPLRT
jgi:hypothetical protein